MPEQADMNAPATKAELRDAVTELRAATKTDLKDAVTELKAELKADIAELRTELKADIAELRTELATKADKADLDVVVQRVIVAIAGSEKRMLAEMARHTMASRESMSSEVAVVDDKYRDLPARVDRLERTVYKRTKRAKPSR